ncbi:helix-turn-helix domain-containing protein [Mycobacterium sp. MS1601]|uniref:helix-turn-helix domain-containing protein n=1 Tax=Mycobacterium sp. MS1601 TaxID=1936029 RepID=UPI003FA5A1C9
MQSRCRGPTKGQTHTGGPLPETLPPWLTSRQTADYLQCSTKHVRRLLAAGQLRGRRIGRRAIRIDRGSLLTLVGAK